MNVRIFRVRAMECMCAQTRPWFKLSFKRVFLGNEVRTHVNSKGKILSTGGSEEDRARNAASRRIVSPTHFQLSYSGPLVCGSISTPIPNPTLMSPWNKCTTLVGHWHGKHTGSSPETCLTTIHLWHADMLIRVCVCVCEKRQTDRQRERETHTHTHTEKESLCTSCCVITVYELWPSLVVFYYFKLFILWAFVDWEKSTMLDLSSSITVLRPEAPLKSLRQQASNGRLLLQSLSVKTIAYQKRSQDRAHHTMWVSALNDHSKH